MKISVVIPAHNEAENIAAVVRGVRAKGLNAIVVDDGSLDASGERARAEGAVVLRHEMRQGKGFSLQQGFQYILEHGDDGVITMDGDGQHSVEDLDRFLEIVAQDPQVVIVGSRMDDPRGMPLIRYLTNRLMSAFISWICRQSIPDTQCGFRYIGREVLSGICLTSRDFEIETEVLIKASKNGYRILAVPVQTIYRNEKSKIRPFRDTARFFSYIIRESFGSKK